jgi:hypothetical protein
MPRLRASVEEGTPPAAAVPATPAGEPIDSTVAVADEAAAVADEAAAPAAGDEPINAAPEEEEEEEEEGITVRLTGTMQTGLIVNSDATVATFYQDITELCEEDAAAAVGELIMTLPDGRELAATDTRTLAECGVVHETTVTVAVRAAELEPQQYTIRLAGTMQTGLVVNSDEPESEPEGAAAADEAAAPAAGGEPINVAVADRVAALQALEVPAAGELPPGWDIRTSRSTGDTYYLNLLTEESTYERPTASALPDGWTHGISSSTGYLYFVSPTGESTYDNPWDAKRGGIKSFGGGLLSKGKAKAEQAAKLTAERADQAAKLAEEKAKQAQTAAKDGSPKVLASVQAVGGTAKSKGLGAASEARRKMTEVAGATAGGRRSSSPPPRQPEGEREPEPAAAAAVDYSQYYSPSAAGMAQQTSAAAAPTPELQREPEPELEPQPQPQPQPQTLPEEPAPAPAPVASPAGGGGGGLLSKGRAKAKQAAKATAERADQAAKLAEEKAKQAQTAAKDGSPKVLASVQAAGGTAKSKGLGAAKLAEEKAQQAQAEARRRIEQQRAEREATWKAAAPPERAAAPPELAVRIEDPSGETAAGVPV